MCVCIYLVVLYRVQAGLIVSCLHISNISLNLCILVAVTISSLNPSRCPQFYEENCIFLCLVCVHVRVCVCACVGVISGETHEEKLQVLGWEGGMGREMWRGEEEHNYVHEMYMLEASLTNINSQQWKRMTGLTFVIYIWKLLHQLRSQL